MKKIAMMVILFFLVSGFALVQNSEANTEPTAKEQKEISSEQFQAVKEKILMKMAEMEKKHQETKQCVQKSNNMEELRNCRKNAMAYIKEQREARQKNK